MSILSFDISGNAESAPTRPRRLCPMPRRERATCELISDKSITSYLLWGVLTAGHGISCVIKSSRDRVSHDKHCTCHYSTLFTHSQREIAHLPSMSLWTQLTDPPRLNSGLGADRQNGVEQSIIILIFVWFCLSIMLKYGKRIFPVTSYGCECAFMQQLPIRTGFTSWVKKASWQRSQVAAGKRCHNARYICRDSFQL